MTAFWTRYWYWCYWIFLDCYSSQRTRFLSSFGPKYITRQVLLFPLHGISDAALVLCYLNKELLYTVIFLTNWGLMFSITITSRQEVYRQINSGLFIFQSMLECTLYRYAPSYRLYCPAYVAFPIIYWYNFLALQLKCWLAMCIPPLFAHVHIRLR